MAGNSVPINEPITGIKLSRNIRNAQKIGESIPINNRIMKLNTPVIKLTSVFIPRYFAIEVSTRDKVKLIFSKRSPLLKIIFNLEEK